MNATIRNISDWPAQYDRSFAVDVEVAAFCTATKREEAWTYRVVVDYCAGPGGGFTTRSRCTGRPRGISDREDCRAKARRAAIAAARQRVS
jgi:hypothetical protein